jgi:hypothetical protein
MDNSATLLILKQLIKEYERAQNSVNKQLEYEVATDITDIAQRMEINAMKNFHSQARNDKNPENLI